MRRIRAPVRCFLKWATQAEMSAAARARFPLAAMLLCGKDAYPDVYAKIFGRPPDKTLPSSLKNG